MAMQTASPRPALDAQVVGNAFVEQYYHILHHSPELVYRFYQDKSVLSRPDGNGGMTTVTTMKDINDKICSLDYKNYKTEINTADAQGSYKDGVMVLVTGCLTGADDLKKKFTQSFFLAPQDKGFYVLNDVYRYVEDYKPDVDVGLVKGVDEIPSTIVAQDPEPARVVYSPDEDYANSQDYYVEIIEENTYEQVIEEKQADVPKDILVEFESHFSEDQVPGVVESVTSSSQEDAPKKSYASIVSSQTEKGSNKVYVPANTEKLAQGKTEKQPLNPAAEASRPESSSLIIPDNAPESKDVHDKVEGHSIYIGHLPLDITVPQLEAEFQKFGTITPKGVQVIHKRLQKTCFGFVEFQEFSSMQNAIKASPITIGDCQAVVEMKRTTSQGGSGRGRYPSSRFRNDSFRGHDNFSSGSTYVRSDSSTSRGNFGGGPSGEGYQQGRGRGGRHSSPNENSAST